MVGLSVVLEGHKSHLEHVINKNIAINGNTTDRRDQQPLVVNATSNEAMVIHHTSLLSLSTPPISPANDGSSAPSANPRSFPGRETEWFNSFPQPSTVFLDRCSLCGTRLVAGRDIYMYKGDRGFCSVECRSRQIILDEQADKRIKQKRKKKKKTTKTTKQGHY